MPLPAERPRAPRSLQERANATVDKLRALEAKFGRRPASVAILVYRWSGGARYQGTPTLVERRELTPSPVVAGEGSTRKRSSGAGTVDDGTLTLREISPRYVEADLDPLFYGVDRDEEVLLEVVHDGRDGTTPRRDGYLPLSRPQRDLDSFDWSVQIVRLEDSRTPEGARRAWAQP